MRVVFCGSGSFATPSLQAVADSNHEAVGVITQPPRRAGRGGKVRATQVAQLAGELDLDLFETADINGPAAFDAIAQARPDVICVADFGQMIGARVRGLASIDAFNLHGSLLPELRGAAPVNWAIIRGYKRTGVTTFSLVDRMDAGAVYLKRATDIEPGQTADQLRARLAQIGAAAVCETLDLLASGRARREEQDEQLVTFAPRLTKGDGIIDWSAAARTICNLVHGTWPWPGAHAVFAPQAGRMVPVTIAAAAVAAGPAAGQPGQLDDELALAAGDGRVRINRIKPAGKNLMAWRDFVNGYRAAAGDSFVDPRTIDNA